MSSYQPRRTPYRGRGGATRGHTHPHPHTHGHAHTRPRRTAPSQDPTLPMTKPTFERYRKFHGTGAPPSAWSTRVWQGRLPDVTDSLYVTSPPHSPRSPRAPAVGLGRATGLSRTPDARLARSPAEVELRLRVLRGHTTALAVDGAAAVSERTAVCVDSARALDVLVGDFRELTMAVTASPVPAMTALAVPVYEAAADASLLAGNLSFYLSCQSRLLGELYDEAAVEKRGRRPEFISYALLYFGVFHVDGLEVSSLLRRMDSATEASSPVKYAFRVMTAFRNCDSLRFIALYKTGNLGQQTILHPVLQTMRQMAMRQIVSAYMEMNKDYALDLMGLATNTEFLVFLEALRPDLIMYNQPTAPNFVFRAPRKK